MIFCLVARASFFNLSVIQKRGLWNCLGKLIQKIYLKVLATLESSFVCRHVCFYINADAHHDAELLCIQYFIYYMKERMFLPSMTVACFNFLYLCGKHLNEIQ